MTLLTDQLRSSIEAWADQLRQHPLRLLAERGHVTPRALGLYLESLRYLFGRSERNLHRAGLKAKELGLPAIAHYFEHKTREEQGHAGWAANDLAKLPDGATSEIRPAHAIVALVDLQNSLIETHPICFVAYVVWAEYLTVLLGEEWLTALAASGYDRAQLSAVANHVDADIEHAALGFRELDNLWQGQPTASVVLDSIEIAKSLFEAFCTEISNEAVRGA